jgi:hypothetical protein
MKRLRNRIAFEVADWQRCRDYHAGKRQSQHHRHAKPRSAGGALALQRTSLPRPVILALWATAAFVMYVLAFGGVL